MKKWMAIFVGVSLVATVGLRAQGAPGQTTPAGQDKTAQDKGTKPMPTTVTYTGCIEVGKQPGSYTLSHAALDTAMEKTSTAGKVTDPVAKHAGTMMLMGDKVDLSKHVGHQVAITGVMADPVKSGATRSEEINKGAAAQPMGGITVTTLKMVGTTCQK